MTSPEAARYDISAAEGLANAAAAIQAGELVVLPTDTVYGVGANPFDASAVQRLLSAKGRDDKMPPPVLIAEPSMLGALVSEVPPHAKRLIADFWPGALTLILKDQRAGRLKLGDTGGTVAVRVPDHDATRALLRRTGPLAVTSANLTGEPPATDCEMAETALGDSVAVYLDGGATPGQAASTIVDFASSTDGRVLRLGRLTLAELTQSAPKISLPETGTKTSAEATETVADTEAEVKD